MFSNSLIYKETFAQTSQCQKGIMKWFMQNVKILEQYSRKNELTMTEVALNKIYNQYWTHKKKSNYYLVAPWCSG